MPEEISIDLNVKTSLSPVFGPLSLTKIPTEKIREFLQVLGITDSIDACTRIVIDLNWETMLPVVYLKKLAWSERSAVVGSEGWAVGPESRSSEEAP